MTVYYYLCLLAMALQNAIKFWAYTSCFKLKVKPWVGYTVFLSLTTAIITIKLYFAAKNINTILLTSAFVVLVYFLSFHFVTEGNIRKKKFFVLLT